MSTIYLCGCGHALHKGKCGNRSIAGTSATECICTVPYDSRYYMDVCNDCGARVATATQTVHDKFHDRLDEIERQAQEYKYPPLIR